MKPNQFIKQLKSNFSQLLETGFICDGEIRFGYHGSNLDAEHLEGLVMRLYFLCLDPEKKINYFINQYEENRFLYFIKVSEDCWLFVLCSNDNFTKLHFFTQYLLSDIELDFEEETYEPELALKTEDEQKMLSAQRIQKLLLPDMDHLFKKYSEAYLWYQPKDAIGGDFYWSRSSGEYDWVVVGDCTGHSVEGALASVSVMSILDQIFNDQLEPHWFIKKLFQRLDNMQTRDLENGYGIGCELMVLKYHRKSRTLHYSSNGLSLFTISNGVKEFKTKSATFKPERVIKYIRSRKLVLGHNVGFFTCSDGVKDQFNERGKKLKSTRLIESVNAAGTVNADTIEHFFNTWKGTAPQTDDVILLYLKPTMS